MLSINTPGKFSAILSVNVTLFTFTFFHLHLDSNKMSVRHTLGILISYLLICIFASCFLIHGRVYMISYDLPSNLQISQLL